MRRLRPLLGLSQTAAFPLPADALGLVDCEATMGHDADAAGDLGGRLIAVPPGVRHSFDPDAGRRPASDPGL